MFCVGPLLGLLLDVFWEPKWRPRASKRGSEKSLKIMMKNQSFFDRFWGPFGVLNGAKNRSKIGHFSSRGPGSSQRLFRGRFWEDFGRIVGDFWSYFFVFLVTFSEGFRACRSLVSYGFLMCLVLTSV